MLLDCIKSENLKLKKSIIYLIIILVPILPAVMGSFNYNGNREILTGGWFSLWTQHTLFYANFFLAPLIAIYCSYILRLEHLNHNWNSIMTLPIKIPYIFLAKLIVVLKIVLLSNIWVFILFYISGKILQISDPFPPVMIFFMLRGTISCCAVISFQLLLSMIIRNFATPVILSFVFSVIGVFLISADKGFLSPYSIMIMGMNSNNSYDMLSSCYVSFFLTVFIYTCIFFFFAALMLKKKDIKSE